MHIYKRELSVANGEALVMPAGETSMCFRIGYPQEGSIKRLQVCQVADDPVQVGYSVRLLDRAVCELGPEASHSAEIDPICFNTAKIIPDDQLPAKAAGESLEFYSPTGYAYRNRVGSYSVPDRAVYLQLTVDDDGQDTNWEVAITGEVGNED